MLGCSKQNLSRWENNPCSTHATAKNAKLKTVAKASALFELSAPQAESLANKAGLSLFCRDNALAELLGNYKGKYCDLLSSAGVSERMFQYYMAGKEPSKQALLAIAVSLGLPVSETETLLNRYGYCLSRSLPNDAVVRRFLENHRVTPMLLIEINEVLSKLDLPELATKLIDR
jgi:transcriptional regulator with XRE-family HTH domain